MKSRNSKLLALFEPHFRDQAFGAGGHFAQLRGDDTFLGNAGLLDLRSEHFQLRTTLPSASDFSLTFAPAHTNSPNYDFCANEMDSPSLLLRQCESVQWPHEAVDLTFCEPWDVSLVHLGLLEKSLC